MGITKEKRSTGVARIYNSPENGGRTRRVKMIRNMMLVLSGMAHLNISEDTVLRHNSLMAEAILVGRCK